MAVIYVPASIEAHASNQTEVYMKPVSNEQEKSVFTDGYRKYYSKDSTVFYGNINCGNDFILDDDYTKCVPVLGPAFMKLNGVVGITQAYLVNYIAYMLMMVYIFRNLLIYGK